METYSKIEEWSPTKSPRFEHYGVNMVWTHNPGWTHDKDGHEGQGAILRVVDQYGSQHIIVICDYCAALAPEGVTSVLELSNFEPNMDAYLPTGKHKQKNVLRVSSYLSDTFAIHELEDCVIYNYPEGLSLRHKCKNFQDIFGTYSMKQGQCNYCNEKICQESYDIGLLLGVVS